MASHSILQTFYASRKWRGFRLGLIAERGNKCEECGRIIAKTSDIIGHHETELTPENVHDVAIALNPDKVSLTCWDCHNKEHQRFGYHSSARKQVYLVYGPPLAGHMDIVHQSMKRGDIIVDMDAIYTAVSGLPRYDKPDNLFQNVIGIHNALLDHVKTRHGKWLNAWVIGGYADKVRRERLANDLGAEMIYCEATQAECLERLSMDESLRHRQKEYEGYISKWFDEYRE
ncbi:HNH endonuclease [Paenibacillus oleatilyticus]|uniref:HNH endonuclease n=1 Tax=Paenibacillus oleatilyticus TaxID=2594886 RepID=UPI001C1FF11D|nr:HNH endonuclease [Paenibacillus oleatilyticus]MBU7320288.1 HNH endonuclease [Paenibacillus oleatilyticus]